MLFRSVTIGKNAKLRNAIIDKQVYIPANSRIGYNFEADKKRFVITRSGIVIVPKKASLLD